MPAAALLAGYRSPGSELGAEDVAALAPYLAQALTYPLVKGLDRVVSGQEGVEEFERGAWRLAAAEHALDRPSALLGLPGET
jgi:hypothetical protein